MAVTCDADGLASHPRCAYFKGMRLHVLQHAAYEGPGEIATWAEKRGHALAVTHLFRGDTLPSLDSFDALVIMGGEMNIYHDRDWPWLKPERRFIATALAAAKSAVGMCLGAQFLSDALGGRVTQNPEYEVGWLPVTWTTEARALLPALPAQSTVLHWHGDTFSLPPGAVRLATSAACPEQAFHIPGRVLALQFHMEVDATLAQLYVDSQGQWPTGAQVQAPSQILAEAAQHAEANRPLLHGLLDAFFAA